MVHKLRIALAASLLALAAVSPVDSASAANPRFGVTPTYYYGGDFLFGLP